MYMPGLNEIGIDLNTPDQRRRAEELTVLREDDYHIDSNVLWLEQNELTEIIIKYVKTGKVNASHIACLQHESERFHVSCLRKNWPKSVNKTILFSMLEDVQVVPYEKKIYNIWPKMGTVNLLTVIAREEWARMKEEIKEYNRDHAEKDSLCDTCDLCGKRIR